MTGFAIAAILAASVGQPAPTDTIVVTGRAPTCRMSGRQLAGSLAAYRRGRATQAPRSTLFFEIEPALRRAGLSDARLALDVRGQVTPLTADGDKRFVLPSVRGSDWELVGDCYGGTLAIRPLVMSPATSAADRRLGDLRLQCEVAWQIARAGVEAAPPGTFVAAPAACKSSAGAIYATSHRAVAAGTIAHGATTRPIDVAPDGFSYSVPLGDKKLPDAARVRLRFR